MKNNKGFSLVELIIVIAILSVITGVSITAIGYMYTSDVKSSIHKLDSSIQKAQSYTVSKSSGGRDVALVIKQKPEDGCYYAEFKGISGQSDEKIGGKKLEINCYVNGSASTVSTSNSFELYFDRSTGGLLPQTNNGSDYCDKIVITTNGGKNKCTIKISELTGKTEVEIFK